MDACSLLRVVRAALVRVLPVAKVHHLRERGDERVRERLDVGEPVRDRGLVRRGRRERLRRERAARGEAELARLAQLCEHRGVPVRPAKRCAVRKVLRWPAQHRGAADVDHLDGFLLAHAVATGDLAERIEVDADEVEGLDRVLGEGGCVLRVVAARQDRGVNPRMQRLDTAAEHLGNAGELFDALDGHPDLVLEEVRWAAAGDELPAELREAASESLQPDLVVDGDQCAHSSRTTCGRSRCSTSWIRSTSVVRGSTATGSWRMTGPVSSPSSTKWIVTPVVSTPAVSASSIACAPGN